MNNVTIIAIIYFSVMILTFVLLAKSVAKKKCRPLQPCMGAGALCLSLIWPFTLCMWLSDEAFDFLYRKFQE